MVIYIGGYVIACYDNLGERIVNSEQRGQLLLTLCLIGQGKS